MKLTITILFLSLASSAGAVDYYVSPSGDDASPCTKAEPCREVRPIAKRLKAGDNVFLADGEYKQTVIDTKVGTKDAPIVIKALGENAVFLPTELSTPTWNTRDNIFVWQSQYIQLRGIKTYNAPRAGITVSNSKHIVIYDVVSGNNGKWGLFTSTMEDLRIFNSEFYGSRDEHGAYLSNGIIDGVVIRNYFHDNNRCGIQTNGGKGSNLRIINNRIERNGAGGGAGINLLSVVDKIDVYSNRIIDSGNSGIAVTHGSGPQENPKDVKIRNNVIIHPKGSLGLSLSTLAGPVIVENNVIVTRSNAYGTGGGIEWVIANNNRIVSTRIVAIPAGLTWPQWQAKGKDVDSTWELFDPAKDYSGLTK